MDGGVETAITPCSIDEFCSGHASKCMQRGDRQKCKCEEGWVGRDCSSVAGHNGSIGGDGGEGERWDAGSDVGEYRSDVPSESEVESNGNDEMSILEQLKSRFDMHQLIIFGAVCLAAMLLVILCVCCQRCRKGASERNAASEANKVASSSSDGAPAAADDDDWDDDDDWSADEESQQSKPLKSAKSNVPAASTPKLPSPKESARKEPKLAPSPAKSGGDIEGLKGLKPSGVTLASPAKSNAAPMPKKSTPSGLPGGLQLNKKAAPKKRVPADDYPPLVPEAASASVFSDFGFSAKPTFAKPKQQVAVQQRPPPSGKFDLDASLASDEASSTAWGDDDDDELDDI